MLLQVEPMSALPVFHALALPASAALIVTAFYLAQRRRRALDAALAFLVLLGTFELLKGLDVEEALLSRGLAVVLVRGRGAFTVRHAAGTLGASVQRARAPCAGDVACGVAVASGVAVDLAHADDRCDRAGSSARSSPSARDRCTSATRSHGCRSARC